MFHFLISMLWGCVSALVVYCANDALFHGLYSIGVLALLMGLTSYFSSRVRKHVKHRKALDRFLVWFLLYEQLPAGAILLFAWFGLFALSSGLITAYLMCLPISLVVLSEWIDLSAFVQEE